MTVICAIRVRSVEICSLLFVSITVSTLNICSERPDVEMVYQLEKRPI